MTDPARIEAFGRALAALDGEIDWDTVAGVYCDGEAAGFFDEERRGAVFDAALKIAADLGGALRPGGRSLYVGAAVAELAPIAYEAIVLARDVRWVTLASAESTELARAFAAVSSELPRPSTQPLVGSEHGPCDHVWMVSVLTDPVAFPALHDRLYGRQGTPDAVGGGRPKAERARARALVEEALAAAAPTALLTSTDEELALWTPAIEAEGGTLDVPAVGRLSPIVGDVVRSCRLVRGRRGR